MSPKDKKRSAFYYFMLEKRDEMVAADPNFKGGLDKMASLVNMDWQAMSTKDKEPYYWKAKCGGNSQATATPRLVSPRPKADNTDAVKRKEVEDLLGKLSYPQEDFVVALIKFSTYWTAYKYGGTQAIPSEIGLVAFSMSRGIFDNYGNLIDPGAETENNPSPRRYDIAVEESCRNQRILEPGDTEEFQNYPKLLGEINEFFNKNCNRSLGAKYFFCLESDIEVAKACLNWICDRGPARAGDGFKILSLEWLAHLMAETAYNSKDPGDPFFQSPEILAAYDEKKSVVGNMVAVSPRHPGIIKNGVFQEKSRVTGFLLQGTYEGYHEMSCSYHLRLEGDGCRYCPLAALNRYAYLLLDVMILNFNVIPKVGFHYPVVNNWKKEIFNRKVMLYYWTSNDFEDYIEVYQKETVKDEILKLESTRAGMRSNLIGPDEPKPTLDGFLRERKKRNPTCNPLSGDGFYGSSWQVKPNAPEMVWID